MKKSYLLLMTILSLNTVYSQHELQKSPTTANQVKTKSFTKTSEIGTKTIVTKPNKTEDPHVGFGTHTCKSHELTQKHYEERGIWEEFNTDYYNSTSNLHVSKSVKTPGVNTISVIFHVVHNPNNPAENVSNALIMQVFNDIQQDFQLLNADAANARIGFGFNPADANINFCLATKTPAGVPLAELGVVRVSTTEDWYNSDGGEENKMKSVSTGGSQIWNRNNYLNVWICDISNGAGSGTAGYAYRPTTSYLPSASIDGIVLDYNLGMNNANVLTHEIGHYLGLDHTWGGSGSCSNDDGFTDTPNTAGPSFNYAGSCSGNQTNCSGVQTQYENYMDYSNCTVMFTQNQADFMLTILSGIRSSLLLSPGCDPVNAPPVANFSADLSSPIIIPVGGSVNFTDLSTNVPTSWLWNFGGGAANQTVQNPSVTFNTLGTYTVSLTATNSYGNDQEVKTAFIQVVAAAAGTACDTLRNYLPQTENAAYYNWQPTTGWGFFPGSGKIISGTVPITHYADKFTAPASTQIRRLIFPISKAVNQSGTGLMKIHIQQDNAGNPGTILVTDTLLIADMDAGYYNEFDFTSPVTVTGNFWVTFELFYGTPQDTIALNCVDFDYRNGVLGTGVNTMKCYYSGSWKTPADLLGANYKSSLWLDVLTSNGPAPNANFTVSDNLVCAGGQITVNGSSSTNTTNYLWYVTDDPVTTIINQNSTAGTTFNFPVAGNRRIYLFADGSCISKGVYMPIVVKALPSAVVASTNTTCGNNNGTITVSSATGGNSPNYSYSIDGVNFQTSGVFTNLASGSYTVTVRTPGNNCDKNYTKIINSSTELTATINPSVSICSGESATLTASGGTGFTWMDGTTNIGSTASISVMPTATNQYSCIVTDGTCQSVVYTYVTVDVCGGINELNNNVQIFPNPTSDNFTILSPGNFNYKLRDARGRLIEIGEATEKVSISVHSIESGVYFITIRNEHFEKSFRIIKN